MFDGQAVSGETEAAKILRQWNTPKRNGGFNADGYEEYPRMLFRARRRVNSQGEPVGPYLVTFPADEGWSQQNCLTVGNAHEEERALSSGEGWRRSTAEAIAHQDALEDEISNAAAERAQKDKRLSGRAQAEAAEVDASTMDHVPEVTPQAVAATRRRKAS